MAWRSTDVSPDWQEGGDVEMKSADGTVVKGYITFDVGADETPYTELSVDGVSVSFYDFTEWRKP